MFRSARYASIYVFRALNIQILPRPLVFLFGKILFAVTTFQKKYANNFRKRNHIFVRYHWELHCYSPPETVTSRQHVASLAGATNWLEDAESISLVKTTNGGGSPSPLPSVFSSCCSATFTSILVLWWSPATCKTKHPTVNSFQIEKKKKTKVGAFESGESREGINRRKKERVDNVPNIRRRIFTTPVDKIQVSIYKVEKLYLR